jgi:ATP/maltotriose-dependent transcriptional regulator MalT
MPRIRDHLAREAVEGLIGRTEELAALLHCLQPGGPRVVHLHGLAGVGKSTLLEAFAAAARRSGVTIVRLDCRGIEPTERGFLRELVGAVGGNAATAEEAADRLGALVIRSSWRSIPTRCSVSWTAGSTRSSRRFYQTTCG